MDMCSSYSMYVGAPLHVRVELYTGIYMLCAWDLPVMRSCRVHRLAHLCMSIDGACGGTSAPTYVYCNHSCSVRVGHAHIYTPTFCTWYTSLWSACRRTLVPAPTILHERDASRFENREKKPVQRHAHFFSKFPPPPAHPLVSRVTDFTNDP